MEHIVRGGKKQKSFWVAIAGGVGISLLCGGVLLLLFTGLAFRLADPTAHIAVFALCALGITAFACGCFCTRLWGHHSLIPALVGGVLLSVLIAACGLCIPGSTLTPLVRCIGCPMIVVLSALGGLTGQKRSARRRRRHS